MKPKSVERARHAAAARVEHLDGKPGAFEQRLFGVEAHHRVVVVAVHLHHGRAP